MKYGDVVLLVIGDKEVPAFVLQSLVHPPADREGHFIKDAEGNFSDSIEHLTVAYPDPGKGVEVMSGQQVQGAIKFLFSVTPWKEGQHIGFRTEAKPDKTLAKYSVEDFVMGCSVGVEIDDRFVRVSVGGRDIVWDRSNGEHSSGALLGVPIPQVGFGAAIAAKAAETPTPAGPTVVAPDPIEQQGAEESHEFIADHPDVPVVDVEPDVTTQLDQAGDPPALGLEPKEPTQQQ